MEKRIALWTGAVVASLNVWTGAPLLALWVGSKAQGTDGLSMSSVGLVVIVLAALELILVFVLTWCNSTYDRLVGKRQLVRRPPPWRSSLGAEREKIVRQEEGVSAIERIVSLSVAAGLAAFQVWFFFFSGSSLPPA